MVATITSMEMEVQKATGVKRKAKEGRQVYLKRLLHKADVLSDDKFHDLPEATQCWIVAGAKAMNAGKDIADFPEEEKPPSASKKGGKVKKKVSSGDSPVPSGAKKARKKTPTAGKAPKQPPAEKKLSGVKVEIKKILLDNPKLSSQDIFAALKKKGLTTTIGTVTGIRSEFRHSLKVLVNAGMIRMDV